MTIEGYGWVVCYYFTLYKTKRIRELSIASSDHIPALQQQAAAEQ